MSKIHVNTPKISIKTPFWPRMGRVKNSTGSPSSPLYASLAIFRLAFFQLFRDWTQRKIWIETFLFNCVLWIRNWERPSEFLILLGFTPREAHHSKCFFFLVFATVGVHTSPEFKRDLYWDCVDSYFRREFFLTNCKMEEEDLIFYWEGWMRAPFIFMGSKWVGLCDLNHMWIW